LSKQESAEPSRAFLQAIAKAGVAEADVARLWQLCCAWRHRTSQAEHIREVVEDYGHWRLYELSRRGDASAAESFEQYWSNAARRFLGRGFTAEQVDEFSSVFFARVYERVTQRDWTKPFALYLRTMLLNVARDEVRRVRQSQAREFSLKSDAAGWSRLDKVDVVTPESALLESEVSQRVQSALFELKPIDRVILLEVLVEGHSGQEVAARLGISRDAVYQRLRRAKQRLKSLLSAAPGP
jgi:RNA polymerase sigma factor (sigma-70 family)